MNDPKVKQQVSEKIKGSSNILVTVSSDPSVDELSAALGLTLLLNKMDKHATAIFSGHVPPAITFLDPEKTFEDTTDSLRDFIIALDKEKADHLRYKLEGDLVKIYITPYRTKITSDDLEFSQGDYNVELVIALGVENKTHLDAALAGHGKILHDATVITLTAGEQTSNLGSIDWHDSSASSLSEMLSSLYDSMKLDRSLLDQPIATAWLTGIVAATERFSNNRTSSRVMTLAAQLMAAGADQQLIASKLAEANPEVDDQVTPADNQGQEGKMRLAEGETTKIVSDEDSSVGDSQPRPDGELSIRHTQEGTIEQVAEAVGAERVEEATRAAQRALEKQEEIQQQNEPEVKEAATSSIPRGAVSYTPQSASDNTPEEMPVSDEPTFGGTLNATSEQAQEDKRREAAADKNRVILSHSYIGNTQPTYDSAINSSPFEQTQETGSAGLFGTGTSSDVSLQPPTMPTMAGRDITPPNETVVPTDPTAHTDVQSFMSQAPTLADLDAQNRAATGEVPQDDARAALDAAFASAAPASEAAGAIPLPPPPPIPTDFSGGLPPLPPSSGLPPERLGDILAADQPAAAPVFDVATPIQQTSPTPTDPGQFRIPGQ